MEDGQSSGEEHVGFTLDWLRLDCAEVGLKQRWESKISEVTFNLF